MRYFLFFFFVVLHKEVPAEWRLHIVDESSLLVTHLLLLLFLLCSLLLLGSAGLKVIVNYFLNFIELLALESL